MRREEAGIAEWPALAEVALPRRGVEEEAVESAEEAAARRRERHELRARARAKAQPRGAARKVLSKAAINARDMKRRA